MIMIHVDPRLRCPCGRTLQIGDLHIDDGLVRLGCARCGQLVEAVFPADAGLEFDFTPCAESVED
jgi:hypothetical protein